MGDVEVYIRIPQKSKTFHAQSTTMMEVFFGKPEFSGPIPIGGTNT